MTGDTGRMRTIAVAVVCAAGIVIHGQTELNGQWKGTTAQGRQVALDLKVNGQELTGSLRLDQQSPADISEGKIEGKAFSFTVTFGGRTVAFAGELAGDELALTQNGTTNPNPVMLKRVK